jgi:hypothetical protein
MAGDVSDVLPVCTSPLHVCSIGWPATAASQAKGQAGRVIARCCDQATPPGGESQLLHTLNLHHIKSRASVNTHHACMTSSCVLAYGG